MAELESKTASATLDYHGRYVNWHRICEDGDEDGEKTWQIQWNMSWRDIDENPDLDFDLYLLAIHHCSTVDIEVEEIHFNFHDELPQDLLARGSAAYDSLVWKEETGGELPGTICFPPSPEHRTDMKKEIYKAKLKYSKSFPTITIQIKYKKKIDKIKERIAGDYRELLRSAENADVTLALKDGQIPAHQVTKNSLWFRAS